MKLNYDFLALFSYFCELCSAAPGVGDIGHDIVGLLDHPLIAPRDSEAGMDSFDTFRKHGIGVVAGIKHVPFWG